MTIEEQRATQVFSWLRSLQDDLCRTFGDQMGGHFERDAWERPASEGKLQGGGITAVQEGGTVMERAGVALSDVRGSQLPPAATARNPHAPTAHMNVRFFSAGDVWWFGGGFDLTPYLPYEDDIALWHRAARDACAVVSPDFYAQARRHCDEYFFLKHRGEARGIGGIFYDDLNEQHAEAPVTWEQGFQLMQRVGRAFHDSYGEVMARRRDMSFTARERDWQLYRRGRYVEFNLVFDRGTLFGLQSGGRTEAILMSMPPEVRWAYRPPNDELNARLLPYLTTLRGKDWLS